MTLNILQSLFETLYCEENEIAPADLARARWMSADGYNLPRVNRAYRYFRAGFIASLSPADEGASVENIALAERLSGGAL